MLRFNENNEVIREDEYRAVLVGLQRDEDISYSMEELKGLAEAAGVEVLGQMIQNLERPNTATLIGKGKVEELAEMVKNMEADTVIFNDELTGMQLRNLEDGVGVRVIDRTILILDIFADRASSEEGLVRSLIWGILATTESIPFLFLIASHEHQGNICRKLRSPDHIHIVR